MTVMTQYQKNARFFLIVYEILLIFDVGYISINKMGQLESKLIPNLPIALSLPQSGSFELPKHCWKCAIKIGGFDPELLNIEILCRYAFEYEYKVDVNVNELIQPNEAYGDNSHLDFVVKLLAMKNKPAKLQNYLHCIRPLSLNSRRIQFIFLACRYCKVLVKNHDNIFIRSDQPIVSIRVVNTADVEEKSFPELKNKLNTIAIQTQSELATAPYITSDGTNSSTPAPITWSQIVGSKIKS
jgi:hypothetical protein